MADFFSSGHALDLVLACVALEILTLLVYRLRRRRNLLPADVLAHLCSAAALLVAARVTVAHGWWGSAGLWLAAALAAHLVALRLRWRAPARLRFALGDAKFSARLSP